MTVFRGGHQPDISTGLLNLHSIKQMLFCIAQNKSSAQELDTYAMLGISNLLEEAGHEIEASYDREYSKLEAARKRHMKLRASLAAYIESSRSIEKSAIVNILAEDEKGGSHD